jgi:hypothetical protein
MSPPRRVILQKGTTSPCHLVAYAHIDPSAIKAHVAETTPACAVVEFWGEGTSTYKQVLPTFGGSWARYVESVERAIGKTLDKTCLTSWSAGSQLPKDVCFAGGERLPDAIVMMDGLYGSKPAGSKPGDGKVVMDPELTALADYAVKAARGGCVFVLFHSKIPTPYASSKECAEAIRAYVESALGQTMTPDATLTAADLDNHQFYAALVLGDFHLVEFPGMDAKEHVTEAHLYDEAWHRWVPWLIETPVPETIDTSKTVGELALELSLAEEAARVGETPPGSNKVKAEYWAGCTRLVNGKETLLKINIGPWCAASFQWASYEAARLLGYMAADVEDWTRGPVPHGRRISVIEVQHDMTQRGLFHSKADVLAGAYDPQPGNAVFLNRPGSTGSDFGHLCRFKCRLDAETFATVGGNEAGNGSDRDDAGDRWRVTVRRYDDPRLRGFGAFPDAQAAPALTEVERKELSAAVFTELDTAMRDWLDRPRPELEEP